MKKKFSFVILTIFILTLLPAITVQAKKPLRGKMDLDFEVYAVWPEEPVWVGTIDIEGYDVYNMRFFHLSPFKEYSQASPFEEYFEIYAIEDEEEIILLAGPDVGVTVLANKPPEPVKYHMNGKIDVANREFSEWMGRSVHMKGIITWQFITLPDETVILVPETAPGEFRIN